MTQDLQPKALMIEADAKASDAVEETLAQAGWMVTRAWDLDMVRSCLERSGDASFALVIAGLEQKETDGIALLEAVRKVSPVSPRMLLLPGDDPEALVAAVNTAGIQACMTYPIDPKALAEQAAVCLTAFQKDLTHIQFKQLIRRHNKKMYEIARNLKRKDHSHRQLLDEKQATLTQLEYDLRQLQQKKEAQDRVSIPSLLSDMKLDKTPDLFSMVFQSLRDTVEARLMALAEARGLEWVAPADWTDNHLGAGAGDGCDEAAEVLIREACNNIWRQGDALDVLDSVDDDDPDWEDDLDLGVPVEAYLELIIEQNGTRALLKKREMFDLADNLDADAVDNYLTDQDISYGRVEKSLIEIWLEQGDLGSDTLIVARAKSPEPSRDGSVTYHFKAETAGRGEVREDGSMDFTVREAVPFVEEGILLAEKILPVHGKEGVSVLGEAIQTPEPLDPPLLAGHGTRISEDGLRVYATDNGQPHVDHLGTVTVNPEYVVTGDVDFKTGNIDFKGNIVVKGRVRQGFSVTGVNLTANEVEGAVISLSGDLNVASGIRDCTIKTVGNVTTKFIHNSNILGFGDFIVLKEIIDSKILLSGRCLIPAGHVIASSISAKNGIEAGKIGTPASAPPVLRVGTEKHIVAMVRKQQNALDDSLKKIEAENEKISGWQKEDQALQIAAREKAGTQKHCRERIETLKQAYLKEQQCEDKDAGACQDLTQEMKQCVARAKAIAGDLKTLYDRQDALRRKIKRAQERINQYEQENIRSMDEKKRLIEYARKGASDTSVIVRRSIVQGTRIQGWRIRFRAGLGNWVMAERRSVQARPLKTRIRRSGSRTGLFPSSRTISSNSRVPSGATLKMPFSRSFRHRTITRTRSSSWTNWKGAVLRSRGTIGFFR